MGVATIRLSFPQLIIEQRYTRDFPAPIAADDWDMDSGHRCIPVPPTDDPGWQIFDTRNDRRTGWQHVRIGWVTIVSPQRT
jgi:hypothetical protein